MKWLFFVVVAVLGTGYTLYVLYTQKKEDKK